MRVNARLRTKPIQGALGSLPAFHKQRQMQPQRCARRRQDDADRGIAGGQKSPIQSRANIVDLGEKSVREIGRGLVPLAGKGLRQQVAEKLGMASGRPIRVRSGRELLQRVDADRLEQAPAASPRPTIHRHQRLRAKRRDPFENGQRRGTRAAGHRSRRIEAEAGREHRQTAEQMPFRIRQQVVTPIHRRPQRLVARQRRPLASCQQLEPIVQSSGNFRRVKRSGACRRKFDRQRNAVEPPADRRDRQQIGKVRRETGLRQLRPGDEQLDRAVSENGRHVLLMLRRRLERWHLHHVLAVDPQGFPAGRENGAVRACPEDHAREFGHRVDHVLAIVENQKDFSFTDRPRDRVGGKFAGTWPEAEDSGNGGGNQRRVG